MGSTKSRRIGLTLVIDWVELDFFFNQTKVGQSKIKKKKKKKSTRTTPTLIPNCSSFGNIFKSTNSCTIFFLAQIYSCKMLGNGIAIAIARRDLEAHDLTVLMEDIPSDLVLRHDLS